MSLSPQWLDELRARITLSGVISRTTRLTKAGREFKAPCPFHNEKTPSFYVNDEKGFYHCFGCGVHGDAIRWLTDQRGMTFMDAVKELAIEAGMEVPAPDPRATKVAEQRDTLHDVTTAAQKWFVDCLASPEGEKARAYLATRGFDAHTVSRFGFGYAPEGRQALKSALDFPEHKLIEAGLRITVDDKEPYDRFRGRLMLPIEDARGRVIAFGGRILDKSKADAPKYLNSPDTPLFDKGRTLYNLHRAGPASRQSGRLIVVEGYMDVIALAAAGIGECVAPLGTALTERQIEMLWRVTEMPILCFDGDAAGQRAAMRAVTRALPLLRPGHSLRIVELPKGLDPDDIVKYAGADGMNSQLEQSFSLVEYLWLSELTAEPLDTPESKANLKERLSRHVETITHPEVRSLYRSELFDRFSKFAYPKREWRKKDKASEDIYSAGRRKLRSTYGSEEEVFYIYLCKRLGSAIAMAFMLYPEQIAIYADKLSKIKKIDRRINVMIDLFYDGMNLNADIISEDIQASGEDIPEPDDFSRLRFPFAWPDFEKPYALATLEKAVNLYDDLQIAREDRNRIRSRPEESLEGELEKAWYERRFKSLMGLGRELEMSFPAQS